ncbi:alkaline phosphatase family protein [Qipengyuania sp. SM2507]
MMLRSVFASLFLVLMGCTTAVVPPPQAVVEVTREPVTILISIDGFMPDYLGRGDSPNLDALAAAGVAAEMRPSFPTKTFPNHYTIVTGLRPDRHGVVDNNMEDAARPDVRFSMGNATQALDPFWWDGGEPIWVTAEKQGVRTATMFWPGSEVAIRGTRPTDWQRFDQNITNPQRVASVVDWLRRPQAARPEFVTLYFDTVDTAGHRHGPQAPETMAAIREVDARIGDLQAELAALGQPVNFVIASDHGMAATSSERVIRADRLLDPEAFRTIGDGAFLSLEPQPGREAEVAAALLKPHDHMECWRKDDIPERFAYGTNPRVPGIFCLAETGWVILAGEPRYSPDGGAHGYDHRDPAMKALFIASGPAFRAGVALPIFDNVAVYPLLAQVLGVTPQPSDGQAQTLAPALRDWRAATRPHQRKRRFFP